MLHIGFNHPDNPLVMAGLSEVDMDCLRTGIPLHTPLNCFGVDLPGTLCVIYGRTEADIEADIRQRIGTQYVRKTGETDPRAMREAERRAKYSKILIGTVGLPRSGKSSWARIQGYPIVNPDSVRLAIHGQRYIEHAEPYVWATAKAMVRALFIAGHRCVILDATNTTRKGRDQWHRPNEWATFWHYVDTTKDECLSRAAEQRDRDIVPVIERMASQWEPLAEDEMIW